MNNGNRQAYQQIKTAILETSTALALPHKHIEYWSRRNRELLVRYHDVEAGDLRPLLETLNRKAGEFMSGGSWAVHVEEDETDGDSHLLLYHTSKTAEQLRDEIKKRKATSFD